MLNEKIHLERIKRFIDRLKESVHSDKTNVSVRCTTGDHPLPMPLCNQTWWQIEKGQVWGQAWSSAWFSTGGSIPEELAGKNVYLWFDCDGEACVFKDGTPWLGLTPKVDWYHNAAKYLIPVSSPAKSGEEYGFLIEAAANDLFGKGKEEYRLRECALVAFNEEAFQLFLDMELLLDLANALPVGSVRRARIIYALNKICNIYGEGKRMEQARDITANVLAQPAHASALTAFSVGHAHLDLAWLWPIRESKRKGGRTFANALRLLERYPEYVFGASQAQLYQWIKEDYPGLYDQIAKRVAEGRWEVQGASWVEFDTNLISGESVIRQFMYGKRFFREEFGIEPRTLWLPDCFGFSGNLPQLMKGCGVDTFVTQKLSWNESNVFPHHLFLWEGIDGTRVLAHQLPTNDYNFSNNPSAFLKTEERFAQSGVCDAYLNLYGIGDGGGGPTSAHLEYGLRQRDLEGVPKFRFAKSTEFFAHLEALDTGLLPVMPGELYLEFHRGTYTTQARTKQNNVESEDLLRAAEAVFAAKGLLTGDTAYPSELRQIWQDTLLLQFHDILPGSSIGKVYEDADALNRANHQKTRDLTLNALRTLAVEPEEPGQSFTVFNPLGVTQTGDIVLYGEYSGMVPLVSSPAELVDWHYWDDGIALTLRLPGLSFASIGFTSQNSAESMQGYRFGAPIKPGQDQEADTSGTYCYPEKGHCVLENAYLKATIQFNGVITSIFSKEFNRELLTGPSNLLQLWEDEPNNWGAWDINHFYRDTIPQEAVNANPAMPYVINASNQLCLELRLNNTTIHQYIGLPANARYLSIGNAVDWQERHKMLRVSFQPDIRCENATCGIQMGSVQRPVLPRNAWEAARFEFPAQGFVDLSDAERGFALICPTKFGYSVQGNRMELNLLRSPADVDPEADLGGQTYAYLFYCHPEPFAQARVHELALAQHGKLLHINGLLPDNLPSGSLFSLTRGRLILNSLKPAEDGHGVILRLFEPLGASASDCLISALPIAKLTRCDLLERNLESLDPGAEIIAGPYEIITLRVE